MAMTAVTIACDNWDPLDSYGQIAGALARHLAADHGVHVNTVTGSRPIRSIGDGETRALLERPRRPASGGIVLGYPTHAADDGEEVSAGRRRHRRSLPPQRSGRRRPCAALRDPAIRRSAFGGDKNLGKPKI